jgi:DNA processing protein
MNATPLRHASSCPDFTISPSDSQYPEELRDLSGDAPVQLFARGSLEVLHTRPRVAIVGTRRATGYGLRVTRELASAFARAGAVVVSGMASGIDGAAHRATLDADGLTIGVLGTGLDQVYPRSHRDLQSEIAARGLLLTELYPDEHGMKFTFIHRNRLIAALCSVVIVVEAPERSGALNTVNHALELGRTIAAVPGPIDQPHSAGANAVIREGGIIITSIEDALALASLTPPPRVPRGNPSGDAGRVWSALGQGGLDIDALCAKTGLPAAHCLAAVTELEVAGSIECALSGVIRRR